MSSFSRFEMRTQIHSHSTKMDSRIATNDSQHHSIKDSVANQTDSGCETKSVDGSQIGDIVKTNSFDSSPAKEDEGDIVILRRDPALNRRRVDSAAYAKLQRSLSPSRNSDTLTTLKEKYEPEQKSIERKPKLRRASAIKLDEAAVHSLRNRSKLPVAKPRSSVKSEIYISHSRPIQPNYRYTLNLSEKPRAKDENSNEVLRKTSSSSGEFITIVTRSESEGSVDKLERELNLFTMDRKPKEKKRSNSFKKIFSSKIFGKEKKKKEEQQNKLQDKQNAARSDNIQNETNAFARDSPYRHTTGGNSQLPKPTRMSRIDRNQQPTQTNYDMKEIEQKYAQMHVREFNNIKQNFDNQQSGTKETPIIINTPGPLDYKNMPNINKFIDTSSSMSTLESDRSNSNKQADNDTSNRFNRFGDSHREGSRDTPPRAQELRQDLRLVNPRALIPINSERPLPNPYQNQGSLSPQPKSSPKCSTPTKANPFSSEEGESKPHFEEAYGTVFDSLVDKNVEQRRLSDQKPPRSPSLESSKLRLPSNREITPLSPRMKSPIPQHHVSTEKIIATELLKPRSRSPTPTRTKKTSQLSPSHQKLELGIDYPENISYENNERSLEGGVLATKPPISRIPERTPVHVQRVSQQSPSFENRAIRSPSVAESQEKVLTNVQIHTNSNPRTPTPNSILHNRSLSPLGAQSLRSSTPDMRGSSSNKSQSPQKEEMRKSVEAYYWKEIKKLKDQENMDLYYYQSQMPFGFAEDPIRRRSRSTSPSSQRNGRRSLSLPRDPKPMMQMEIVDGYGRFQPTPIPEGRAVTNRPNGAYYHTDFRRNVPERRTIDTFPRTNGNYANGSSRPNFKRGSLTTPLREMSEDQQNKKVSFGNPRQDPLSNQAWPTKNGFTQSPPQRRMEKNRLVSLEDDVFLPNPPQASKLVVDGREIYGYANRPYGIVHNYENAVRQQAAQHPQYPGLGYRQESVYGSRQLPPQEEIYYGHVDTAGVPQGLTRHGSLQLTEPLYVQQRVPRRLSQGNAQVSGMRPGIRQAPGFPGPRRQIIVQDDIYGQFAGYIVDNEQNSVYASRQSVTESPYGYSQGVPRQVSVKNKVCDIYGQIHDRDSPSLTKPNHLKQTGVILGQLQGSPRMVRQSHGQLASQNFVRNSRLTASANDMYRRHQNVDPRYVNGAMYGREDPAPNRPLPPVPTDKRVMMRHSLENSSNASDIQRVNSINGKSKKRGLFGYRADDLSNSHLSRIDEETKGLCATKLERLVLLEKLQLLKMKQQIEIEKRENRTSATFYETSDDTNSKQYSSNHFDYSESPLESEDTQKLNLADLKRVVLLEELYLVRMKLRRKRF
ncbi:uncharacterized protein isoform X1 [Leptinotarsa decemlineata]|uniref:uncharacterized protein isoform X1 n=2 Tax=Leptinotarsa decemlineata TaxID=7539 RepID=UPI003D30C16F